MLQHVEYLARVSVARGCAFGLLAVGTFMIGFADRLAHALQAAGAGMAIMAGVLAIKAMRAPRRPYKRTELWLMIRPEHRPAAATAQLLIGRILRETYLHFATRTATVAVFLLTGGLLKQLLAPT